MALYCPDGFDLDPTYSTGNFYKAIKEPMLKMDLSPQAPGTTQADATAIPLKSDSLNSIMFDPPFVAAIPKGVATGIITTRFSYFRTIQHDLWPFYEKAITEFYRVLKQNGILVFKCQDTVDSSKQYMTHVHVMNLAVKAGFYPKDLFILTADNRILNQATQIHARKYHSYFWVFTKQKTAVDYSIQI